jgi:hypothetical protein
MADTVTDTDTDTLVCHSSHTHCTYAFCGREEEDLLPAKHLAQYVVEGVLVARAL